MPHRLRVLGLLIALAWLVPGCSPPHTNPFDPDSDSYIPLPITPAPETLLSRLRSVHTAQTEFIHAYAVWVEAWSAGPLVLDSVTVSYAEGAPVPLDSVAGAHGLWFASLSGSRFGDPRLGSVVGQPFAVHFYAGDSGFVRTPCYIFRVLEGTPRALEPDSLDLTGPNPVLVWDRFTANYPFTYQVTVSRQISAYRTVVVWDTARVAPTIQALTVSDSLEDGRYFWVVTVADTFENLSESMEGHFEVRAGGLP